MDDNNLNRSEPAPQYDETKAPQNPPNAVAGPGARREAFWSSFGTLIAVFAIVVGVFVFMLTRHRGPDPRAPLTNPAAVGTSGEQQTRVDSPGGFNPTPHPDSTKDELKQRGGANK